MFFKVKFVMFSRPPGVGIMVIRFVSGAAVLIDATSNFGASGVCANATNETASIAQTIPQVIASHLRRLNRFYLDVAGTERFRTPAKSPNNPCRCFGDSWPSTDHFPPTRPQHPVQS